MVSATTFIPTCVVMVGSRRAASDAVLFRRCYDERPQARTNETVRAVRTDRGSSALSERGRTSWLYGIGATRVNIGARHETGHEQ